MSFQVSEYVSPGHPDKIADAISSYLLDRYLEKDATVRFAVETLVKERDCVLAGELTSHIEFRKDEIAKFVKEAYSKIGYTDEYALRWGHDNVCGSSALNITQLISRQSPDIAKGVDRDGWGDQGVFWGMAVDDSATNFMPKDCWLARHIGSTLYHRAKSEGICGLDIKTLVALNDGKVEQLIVAAPLMEGQSEKPVFDTIHELVDISDEKIVLNGTGRYVVHGIIGDSGLTGRKLAVDFYGSNCVIGGGSPHGKDPTKADVSLNIMARKMAKLQILNTQGLYKDGICFCGISCAIGQSKVKVVYKDSTGNVIEKFDDDFPVSIVVNELGLTNPNYFERAIHGLFAHV